MGADRRDKVPLYAEASIPECWVVDVTEETVEVYRQPVDGTYQSVETRSGGDILRPGGLPMIAISLSEIW